MPHTRRALDDFERIGGEAIQGADHIREDVVGNLRFVGRGEIDDPLAFHLIKPEDFGITPAPISALQVANPAESIARMKVVLANEQGPSQDIVLLNAGAALYAAGRVESIADGIAQARQVIASGAALNKLNEFIATTQTV